MKTMQKILMILIIGVCAFTIMPRNTVMAAASSAKDAISNLEASSKEVEVSGLQTTIGTLLGFLQIASGLVSVLMIAIVGFNYIIATPQLKEELKNKMLPIIVGLVLVFGAVSIAKFILGAVGQ